MKFMAFMAFVLVSSALLTGGIWMPPLALHVFQIIRPPDAVVSVTMEPRGCDELLTLTYKSGKVEQFRGNCTVWHSYPDGQRQGFMIESWLADIWQQQQWKREDAQCAD